MLSSNTSSNSALCGMWLLYSRIRSSLPLDQQLCRKTQLHIVFLLFVLFVCGYFTNADIWLYSGQRSKAKRRDCKLWRGRLVPGCMPGGAAGDPGCHSIESLPFAFCFDQELDNIWIDKVKISKVHTQAQSTLSEDKQSPQYQKEVVIDEDRPELWACVPTVGFDSQNRSQRQESGAQKLVWIIEPDRLQRFTLRSFLWIG